MNISRWFLLRLAVLALVFAPLFPAKSETPPVPARTSATLSQSFLETLRSGEAARLRAALDQGAPINCRDADGNTALMHAATYGDTACVRLLLDRGAEVNAANPKGATALMRAAAEVEKVRLLLDRGADVHARSALGNTALMLVARQANSHRAVELLLARGAKATATNHFGSTALMAAVAGGNERSVRALLKHGADVNAQPTPDEPGFVFGGGRTALMWAAYRGNVPLIHLLLDAGADVNTVTGLGTALTQTSWAGHTDAARVLIERGARIDLAGPRDGYTALHWAASTDDRDPALTRLLLDSGADPNLGGGEQVDAFLGTAQTPLMLARRRGDTPIVALLTARGATNARPDRVQIKMPPPRRLPHVLDGATRNDAIARAVPPLQATSLKSKQSFVRHESKQDCTSCHQQHLPMAALAHARKQQVSVDREAEQQLIQIVRAGEIKDNEVDWQALFHPDAVYTKGYELLALAAQDLPGDAVSDAWVHHIAAIQGRDGQWHNNLPRPPLQTDDIGATALAIHALQRYPLPGRKAEFAKQVQRARRWLWTVKPQNNDGRIFQLLGLAWAGESAGKLQPLAKALLAEQRADGGWSQLPGTGSDAYGTAQALYALRVGAQLDSTHSGIDRGLRYLLTTQLEDGTWHVRRRAFPFQPTMESGFPHGKDSWISAAATSWAVMALSLPDRPTTVASKK